MGIYVGKCNYFPSYLFCTILKINVIINAFFADGYVYGYVDAERGDDVSLKSGLMNIFFFHFFESFPLGYIPGYTHSSDDISFFIVSWNFCNRKPSF